MRWSFCSCGSTNASRFASASCSSSARPSHDRPFGQRRQSLDLAVLVRGQQRLEQRVLAGEVVVERAFAHADGARPRRAGWCRSSPSPRTGRARRRGWPGGCAGRRRCWGRATSKLMVVHLVHAVKRDAAGPWRAAAHRPAARAAASKPAGGTNAMTTTNDSGDVDGAGPGAGHARHLDVAAGAGGAGSACRRGPRLRHPPRSTPAPTSASASRACAARCRSSCRS